MLQENRQDTTGFIGKGVFRVTITKSVSLLVVLRSRLLGTMITDDRMKIITIL